MIPGCGKVGWMHHPYCERDVVGRLAMEEGSTFGKTDGYMINKSEGCIHTNLRAVILAG